MSEPEDQMGGDRRSPAPVSLDVIAYQVGALQTSVDRGLSGMERVIDRGLADVRVEVAGLATRLGEIEQQFVRIDTRVEALESLRIEEEERQRKTAERAEARAEVANVDQAQLRMWRWLAVACVGAAAIGSLVVAIVGS
jgi:hypothetical protein